MKKKPDVRGHLIAAGVKNLKEFGYPAVDSQNILTNRIYAEFFLSMLKDNYGAGYDKEIDALVAEVEEGRAK